MTDKQKIELKEIFLNLGPEALTMSHYDLAEATEVTDPQAWKDFLRDIEISQWLDSEIAILRDVELRRLTNDVSKSRSVGQAQLINALSKVNENVKVKEGPAFIYCYVPLTQEQEASGDVLHIKNDPFVE